MKAGHLIVGYHGCDAVIRDDLVSRRLLSLDQSRNDYDWLGPGVYFFENDAERAFHFADHSHKKPEAMYTKQPIASPAVVGALIRVNHWLDMTTQLGMTTFANAYDAFLEEGVPMKGGVAHPPVNAKAHDADRDFILRKLDNAIFSYLHGIMEEQHANNPAKEPPYQIVRGAFPQGKEITPNSGFREDSHIQLAVRDQACIVGWFMPEGSQLLTPDQYDDRKNALETLKRSRRKPVRHAK